MKWGRISTIIIAILLLSSSSNPTFAMEIDKTKIGVKAGDWFIHEIIQGNVSFVGDLEVGEVEPGDLIKTTVNGFSGDMVNVTSEFDGNEDNFVMNMSDRVNTYIMHTDWDYWEWKIQETWNWDDFLNNQTAMDEAGIAEAYMLYDVTNLGGAFNASFDRYIGWSSGSKLYQTQITTWDAITGIMIYAYANATGREGLNPFDTLIWENKLVEWSSSETTSEESTNFPIGLIFISTFMIMTYRIRSRRE